MSIGYATQRGISGRIRRWSNLVSNQASPLTFTLSPAGNFTTTATNQWKKTAGGAGWNSNVFGSATNGLTTGTMICKSITTNLGWMCGMSTNRTTLGYATIDWGISVQAAGTLEIYNSGGSGGSLGTYNATTEIKMVWTTTQMFYYINNVLRSTFTRPNSNALYLNWCFESVNAEGVLVSLGL